MAPGKQLNEVAIQNGGKLTLEQQRMYIDATLDLAVKGKDMPDSIAYKPAIRSYREMERQIVR